MADDIRHILYKQLMYCRPQSMLRTRNKIDRSQTISYRVGGVIVVCTAYPNGKYSADARGVIYNMFKAKLKLNFGKFTDAQARAIYEHAKQYCR